MSSNAFNDFNNVIVTVLAGGRPELLKQTLHSLEQHAPELLDTAQFECVLNCPYDVDNDSHDFIADFFSKRDDEIAVAHTSTPQKSPFASVGVATSRAALLAASAMKANEQRRFWMHLEDDWIATEPLIAQLDRARAVLDAESAVRQVRLRHATESVLSHHQVTGKAIEWKQRADGWLEAGSAHLTWNPFLARTEELTRMFPTAGERAFQSRAHRAHWTNVVQTVPGSFMHIGGGELSLRLKTRCKT